MDRETSSTFPGASWNIVMISYKDTWSAITDLLKDLDFLKSLQSGLWFMIYTYIGMEQLTSAITFI